MLSTPPWAGFPSVISFDQGARHLRVLTFLHSFEPGGVERIALRLIRRWRAEGIDAPLFLGRTDGVMAQDVGPISIS